MEIILMVEQKRNKNSRTLLNALMLSLGLCVFAQSVYAANYGVGLFGQGLYTIGQLLSSSTALVSNNNPSIVGDGVTFTATISPSTGTGLLVFKDGTTTIGTINLGHGSGSLTVSSLTVGSHSITATYGGNNTYDTSTSSILTQTVNDVTSSSSSSVNVGGGGGGGGGTRGRTEPTTVATAPSASSNASAVSSVSATAASASSVAGTSQTSRPSSSPSPSLALLTNVSNLRSGPSTTSSVIVLMSKGWEVVAVDTQGAWTKVRTISGKEGFIITRNLQLPVAQPEPVAPVLSPSSPSSLSLSSPFPSPSLPSLPSSPSSLALLTNVSNLRSGPSTTSSVIVLMSKGWEVVAVDTQGAWTKVRTISGKEGFIITRNLQLPVAQPEPVAPVSPFPAPRTTTVSLLIRMYPSQSSARITALDPETSIQVLAVIGDWAEIQYASYHGYVLRKYLRK